MSPKDSPQTKTNIWEGLMGGFLFLEVLVLGLNPGSSVSGAWQADSPPKDRCSRDMHLGKFEKQKQAPLMPPT